MSSVCHGVVVHRRLAPPRHAFRYRLFMLLLDLDELPRLDGALRLFGHNRARPVSFRDGDHWGEPGRSIGENLTALLRARGVPPPGGQVLLLTHARVFGYVFNPVSFFYCHDRAGRLRVVVAEVNNTFGERFAYVMEVRGRPDWREKKVMHVSPFFSMAGTYRFRVPPPEAERVTARVDLWHASRPVLVSRLSLDRRPLTDAALAAALVRRPLSTLQVTAGIHWQALRLWRKRARVFEKPPFDPEAARGEPA